MDDYRLPDSEIFALKLSDKVIRHKTLKVKREADKVKVVADLLDLDEQTVRNTFSTTKIETRKTAI